MSVDAVVFHAERLKFLLCKADGGGGERTDFDDRSAPASAVDTGFPGDVVGDDPPLGSDAQFVARRTVDGPPAEERLARRNLCVVRRGDRRHRTAGDILLDDFAGDGQE